MTALFSVISFVFAYFAFPVPLSPSFARMDFLDFPVLIRAFTFGPTSGVMIEFVKNALQLISTLKGVFMFPNEKAAEIAVQTVKQYKVETGRPIEVIFNVFKDVITKSAGTYSDEIKRLKEALDAADAVVIGADAGLSTSADFIYTGERFETHFPISQ